MRSRKATEMREKLLHERDRLLRQKEAIENQIAGLERAISLVGSESESTGVGEGSGRRTATKGIVLDLLQDVGTTGLNAGTAVDLANTRGVTLDRASVSSLLSRLKKDGVVTYDGERYRLGQFAPKLQQSDVEDDDLPDGGRKVFKFGKRHAS